MSKAEYDAHQKRHGFMPQDFTIQQKPIVLPKDKMNKTEREYSFILEAQKRSGEILRWDYEGITLRWGGLRYTPDFLVLTPTQIKLVETKGPYIREDAMVKFKAAKAYWSQFIFELWQKSDGQWRQLY